LKLYDIDWRAVLNEWDDSDLLYLRSIIDEKLQHGFRRKTLICKKE
jgi:hypothetical protein